MFPLIKQARQIYKLELCIVAIADEAESAQGMFYNSEINKQKRKIKSNQISTNLKRT